MTGGALQKPGLLDAMLHIVRHGLRWHLKDCGFIHVVPEAGYAIGYKILVERSPPDPCLCLGKVRKNRGPRPHHTHVCRAIRQLHKAIFCNPRVVGGVAGSRLPRDVRVCDDDEMELVGRKLLDHLRKFRKSLRVDGEGHVVLLEVDV